MAENPAIFVPLGESAGTEEAKVPCGQTVLVQLVPPAQNQREQYDSRKSRILGCVLIISGIISVIAQTAALLRIYFTRVGTNSGYFTFYGYWCPVLILIAGAFAIVAARDKKIGIIVAGMILSIIAALMALVELGIAIASVAIECENRHSYLPANLTTIFLDLIMVLMGLVALITSIWTSVLGCKVTCCSEAQSQYVQPQVLYVNTPVPYPSESVACSDPQSGKPGQQSEVSGPAAVQPVCHSQPLAVSYVYGLQGASDQDEGASPPQQQLTDKEARPAFSNHGDVEQTAGATSSKSVRPLPGDEELLIQED